MRFPWEMTVHARAVRETDSRDAHAAPRIARTGRPHAHARLATCSNVTELHFGDAAPAIRMALMHRKRTIQRKGCELASVFSAHSIDVAVMLLDAGNFKQMSVS